jgi:hypothetical protein
MEWFRSRFRSIFHVNRHQRHNRDISSMINFNVEPNSSLICSNTIFNANKLVDRLLDYVRDNYVKQIDPYEITDSLQFKYGNYGKN